MLAPACLFCLFFASFFACLLSCGWLGPIAWHRSGKDQPAHPYITQIDCMSIAVNQGECRVNRIEWFFDLGGPFVGRPAGKDAHGTLAPDVDDAIDHLVECAIATIGDDQ